METLGALVLWYISLLIPSVVWGLHLWVAHVIKLPGKWDVLCLNTCHAFPGAWDPLPTFLSLGSQPRLLP